MFENCEIQSEFDAMIGVFRSEMSESRLADLRFAFFAGAATTLKILIEKYDVDIPIEFTFGVVSQIDKYHGKTPIEVLRETNRK